MKAKKLLALILALVLIFALTACGKSQKSSDSDSEFESYLIGFNTWGSGTPTFDVMGNETAYAIEVLGATGSRASDDFTADKELQNIQNFISAGVDGIAMQATADPVLPQAAEACKNAEIPFVLPIFVGDDNDRAEISANNPYYVGAVNADLFLDGYIMGQAAARDGHKKAILVGGNIGDNHMEQRIEGFTQSFVVEGGGEILGSARCSSPAECQEKANALLSANRDADCLYAMVSDYCPGSINAMDNLDINIPVYVSNANTETPKYVKEGRVAACAGGNDLASNIAVALLINYLDGHPIKDENGKAPEFKTHPFTIDNDNVDDFIALFCTEGVHPITEDSLKSLCWRFNKDVSYQTFVDFINNNLTLEALKEAHNK